MWSASRFDPWASIIYYLPQVLINSKIALYADDTIIYYQSNDINEINLMLNEDMQLIHNWLKVNR